MGRRRQLRDRYLRSHHLGHYPRHHLGHHPGHHLGNHLGHHLGRRRPKRNLRSHYQGPVRMRCGAEMAVICRGGLVAIRALLRVATLQMSPQSLHRPMVLVPRRRKKNVT